MNVNLFRKIYNYFSYINKRICNQINYNNKGNNKYEINSKILQKQKENINKHLYISENKFQKTSITNIIIIYLFFSFLILSKQLIYRQRKLNEISSEIIIKINESGLQEILYKDFQYIPLVYVNETLTELINTNKVELNEGDNIIKMVWNIKLTTCENMFKGLSNITEVDLTKFDSSNVISTSYMFNECTNLKFININENFNTSLVTSMNNMFSYCKALISLNISHFNTTLVKNFDFLFSECNSLKSLDISNFITSQATNMKYMFSGCHLLTSLNLSNFQTLLVTDSQGMFKDCRSLITLNLSKFNTSRIKNMESMFQNCYSLIYLNLFNFNTSSVTNMKNMFSNCLKLTSLNISSFSTFSVKYMQNIFSDCNSLISIDLSNFNTTLVINMESMFKNCYSLTSLDLSNFNTSQVTNMKNMFSNCKLLKILNLNNYFNTDLVNNMQYMFSGLNLLESLDLSNFNTSLVTNMQHMFSYCNSLISLDLSNFNTSSVKIMKNMFYNCTSLLSLNISNFDVSSVTNFQNMFNNCTSILSLDLSSFNTSFVIDMRSMFENCLNLVYINISNFIANTSLNNKNMFKQTKDNLVYCIKDEINADIIVSQLTIKKCSIKDCSINWKERRFKEEKNNTQIFYNKCVYGLIKEISEDFYLSNIISNISIYSYSLDTNMDELKNKYCNLTLIDFSEKIDFILEIFNLDLNDKIYILISDQPSNDSWMATSDFYFKLLLENGTELNLSLIQDDIYLNIYIPIRNLDLANFNYYLYFTEQGYDIYNKKSKFYNDLCSPAYYYNNDIILKDRKKEIYPNNVTLCKDNCIYKSVDIKDKRIICECNLNNNNNNTKNEKNIDFLNEDGNNNETILDYFLDNINYKIFVCGNVLLSFNNLIRNIGFYIILSLFLIIIFFNFKFFFCGIQNIRIAIFEEMPSGEKENNLKKKNFQKKIKLNKKEENDHSINKKLIIKKRNVLKDKKKIINNKKSQSISEQIKNEKKYLNFFQTNINNNLPKKDLYSIIKRIRYEDKLQSEKETSKEIYNELPYTKALIKDDRNICKIFLSILFEKIELINLFTHDTKIKDIIICEYILSLLIDFFFNALFYSDNVISHKYHNNGKLDFLISLVITLLSNIIVSIICHFLTFSKLIEEKLDRISKIRIEFNYLYFSKKLLKYMKLKLFFLLINEFIIIIFSFYYVVIFCIIYNQTQLSLVINYLTSLLENLIKSIIVTTIVAITRKIGIVFLNVYFYNISKYINSNF